MGYNWAGMGSQIGAGFNQGLMQALAPRMELSALKRKIDYLKGLPEADRSLALQMMGKSDPMAQLANMLALGMTQGTNQQGATATTATGPINPKGLSSPVGSPNFKVGDKVRLKDGSIYTLEDQADIDTAIREGAAIYK